MIKTMLMLLQESLQIPKEKIKVEEFTGINGNCAK
jgi:NADP-dependent 3-hydroxy acid dehydrogenase YdfG